MNYWWLNVNPKKLRFREIDLNDIFEYSILNEDGSLMRFSNNFQEASVGDTVIVYEIGHANEIIGICTVYQELKDTSIKLMKMEGFADPVPRYSIEENREIVNIEAFRNQQGSFFKLSKQEYDAIMIVIREYNPQKKYTKIIPYNKDSFLSEVFFDENEFDELKNLILSRKNVILQGVPGVGKTYISRKMAYAIMGEKDDDKILCIQFHPEYSTDEFLEGYRPDGIGIYKFRRGCFKIHCAKAANDPTHKYFVIIDEINRGNIAKIFGESFMLIEPNKRGKENYIELSCSKERFFVPENLYIIGTTNTTSHEFAITDFALRRRFAFYTIKPIFNNKKFIAFCENDKLLSNVVKKVNEINETLDEKSKIGHCYFCEKQSDEELKMTVKYNLIPLIQEYFYNNEDKAKEITSKLESVIKEDNNL